MKSLSLISMFLVCLVFALPAQTDGRPDALREYRAGRDLEGAGRIQDANVRYTESVRICRNEITSGVATADTYVVQAWSLQRLRNYNEVIAVGNRGLSLYPNDYRINEVMGEAYFYLDDYENSLSSMQRFVNALPSNDRTPTAYFFIGEIFRLQGKFLHADIAYSMALTLSPNMPLWWYRLGLAREGAREYETARQARLNPVYPEATDALARVRARLN